LEDLKAFKPKEVLLAINLCKLTKVKNTIKILRIMKVLKYQEVKRIKKSGHPLSLIKIK